jgi:hypothetical protein
MTSQDDDARDHDQQRSHLARDPRRAGGEFFIQPEVRQTDRNDRIARTSAAVSGPEARMSSSPCSAERFPARYLGRRFEE